MSAIINNSFRKYNADNFISSISSNKVYLMIGKNDPWANADLGQYVETNPSDIDVPVPIDTSVSQYIHYNEMIAAKLISSTSVSHVLKRVNWTSGTTYPEYNQYTDDIIDTDFFVFTEAFRVYKCISNFGSTPSTIQPTGTSAGIIETSDNYRWKFMFEVQQSDVLKFVTTDWIPVNSPANATAQPEQKAVEDAAVSGALEHIAVTAGGALYKAHSGLAQTGTSTSVTLAATGENIPDYYNNMTVYLSSGVGSGQLRTISDYNNVTKIATVTPAWSTNPDGTSEYEVMPAITLTPAANDAPVGSGAVARVSGVTAGAITKVSMVSVGSNYRFLTAAVTSGLATGGTAATLAARTSPPGGHGKNAVSELGGAFVMLNVRLIGNEGNDFPIDDDFRKVHLVANPTASGSAATGATYNSSELDQDSGSIIYTEFRGPIVRASDSTEDIKLVCEF
jgi:hypothetical protein